MRTFLFRNFGLLLILVIPFVPALGAEDVSQKEKGASPLLSLLPEVNSWKLFEAPQNYLPDTLFQYIDGGAEIYLSYDFQELIVAQYKMKNSEASLTLEIYDMGNEKNSFGIYAAERFPESHYLSIGNQGYLEEGALNFISAKNYIKLLCFEGGNETDTYLKLFAEEVAKKIKEKGSLPILLQSFPQEGLIANSEKFILRNFMGFSFLHDGYLASYKQKDLEFDCFIVEGKTTEEAEQMLQQSLDFYAKNNWVLQKISLGCDLKGPQKQHIYFAQIGHFLFGVNKIKDGLEGVGEKYLGDLAKSLQR
jgi:hypothetical protein